ncbi:hypothetical protein [Desmospora activa]|uniref:Uncharacterized protein n=1 Tax=Desmospora activa DSM 45169 TaxID=1121389 RepID=A0A2T4ZDU3_9BACL|nr:hypothetical protein [Desmospora activa]PTM60060.1 hypothetical protein C8J48_2699 [Desmospora activa DSM 45169]
MTTPCFAFPFDERLGVRRPRLFVAYEELSREYLHRFELGCQEVCSDIPERIRLFERRYMHLFEALNGIEREAEMDRILEEMNDLSSRIADLNVLYLHIEGTYIGANVHA